MNRAAATRDANVRGRCGREPLRRHGHPGAIRSEGYTDAARRPAILGMFVALVASRRMRVQHLVEVNERMLERPLPGDDERRGKEQVPEAAKRHVTSPGRRR